MTPAWHVRQIPVCVYNIQYNEYAIKMYKCIILDNIYS